MVFAILIATATSVSARAAGQRATQDFIIATDTVFAPFVFQNPGGPSSGIDMEILAAIAKDQGFTYTLQHLGFHAALAAVEAGQADGVMAGMSITEPRRLVFDFSDPYFDSGLVMAVRADNRTINSYADLRGQTVAVKTGTTGSRLAESLAPQYGFNLVYFDESSFMYEAVRAGHAVAVFEDYPVMAYGITQGNGLRMATAMEAGASYGFAVRRGQNQELLRMFNQGLRNIKASGVYQQILDKYLGK